MQDGADETWKRKEQENVNQKMEAMKKKVQRRSEEFIVYESIITLDHQPFWATLRHCARTEENPSYGDNVDLLELRNHNLG